MITNDELDRRMSLADPARHLSVRDDSLGDLLTGTGDRAHKPRSRRRLFTGLGVAGVVLIGGATALPAAADAIREFLAQSDWDPPAGGEILANSPWVDTGASDFVNYTATVFPSSLPLPDGVDSETLRVEIAESMHGIPALTQEISVVRRFEAAIYCVWVTEWLENDDVNDVSGRDAASQVMIDYASWPGLVATDGGGIADRQLEAGKAALGGDRSAVRRSARDNACSPVGGSAQ